MILYKIFTGTLEEIAAAFSRWAASLPQGANVNCGPLTPLPTQPVTVEGAPAVDMLFMKDVVYVLPVRNNSGIAVPERRLPGGA